MQINYLQLSNILTFAPCEKIQDAERIAFNEGMNIIIGENGAGKSTVLEVINFLFKRVLFKQYTLQWEYYEHRHNRGPEYARSVLQETALNRDNVIGYRLDANWNSSSAERRIFIEIELDDIDRRNIKHLYKSAEKLQAMASRFSHVAFPAIGEPGPQLQIEVTLSMKGQFSVKERTQNPALDYFVHFHYYNALVHLHNMEHRDDQLAELESPFVMVSGYRNYQNFTPVVSLATATYNHYEGLRQAEYARSFNSIEQQEPAIFNLVKIQCAAIHFNNVLTSMDSQAALDTANASPFMAQINQLLRRIGLKVRLEFVNQSKWEYAFYFYSLRSRRPIQDINSLSAGQKAIIHLVFETYGRTDLNAGLVIIDEPELHLHHQFQHLYLAVLTDIMRHQYCQYIIVTHSDAFINSETIHRVTRFSLDRHNHCQVHAPAITTSEKNLIRILDNSKSTYAFFGKKVVLVEGDTDRYFFRAVFRALYPDESQDISILHIGGKGNYRAWRDFFHAFGLEVYYIGDFDNLFTLRYPGESVLSPVRHRRLVHDLTERKLDAYFSTYEQKWKEKLQEVTSREIRDGKQAYQSISRFVEDIRKRCQATPAEIHQELHKQVSDMENVLHQLQREHIFILRAGALEVYTHTTTKEISKVVELCENIDKWLNQEEDTVREIIDVVKRICVE